MSRFANTDTFYSTQKTVTTSGTPVNLTAMNVADGVTLLIKAKSTNTGVITVGNSSANALNTSGVCFRLLAGEALGLQVNDASSIWIDSTVSGDIAEVILEKS